MTPITPENVRIALAGERVWTTFAEGFGIEHLGFLPEILLRDDPRPVKDQLDDRYRHGGGYRAKNFDKFKLGKGMVLRWPGDEPQKPLAATLINDELVVFYEHALLLVMQPDGSFEVTRVD
ncbi:MAG TPA: hypothetical protein VGG86_20890 [Roseiarcus sp.]|jgi:hypothetical protein